jgi:UDP-glucose:(heptosyl)LPS alpha-1,3-glucosyltransferase
LLKLEQEMFLPGRFQLYVANSGMIRRAVTHMFGVDPTRILVIPNGVDSTRFHPGLRARRDEWRAQRGLDASHRLVLFSGMDFRRKGLLEAALGFIELARNSPDRQRLRFACVGAGDVSDAQRAFAEAGIAAQATFHPPTSAIEQWYASADVFLLPTMHDPSANAVTESLACGLPVVTSGENGARQHIVAGRNGVVLQNRMDIPRMAKALRMMLDSAPSPEVVARISRVMTTQENAGLMLDALQRATQYRARKVTVPPYVQSGNRAAMLRALKRRMWAEGDTRDYREVFKAMLKQGQ